ncbi:MAG: hypothetical protein GF383_08530 [Candidatus Lokiarchaeota archaeon]|nr:hypothetical protein [Candidatus Lokiarchaeota archaeon]MBD3340418.1 hypothetical protein [Candidatus Lokiarchaeota archaeon]
MNKNPSINPSFIQGKNYRYLYICKQQKYNLAEVLKMPLEEYAIVNGITSLIYVVISIIIGLRISSRYFKYKDINLILVGFSWIIICEPWIAQALTFLVYLATQSPLTNNLHIFIGYFFLPIGMLCWIRAFTNLVNLKKQRLIFISFVILEIFFTALFLYFLVVNISLLGIVGEGFDISYGPVLLVFLLIHIVLLMVSGALFARESLKFGDKETKLKGKFLIIAFISYMIGSFLSLVSPDSIWILVIARIINISAAFEFYCGFILPEKIAKIFIR